jgi:signal transduction histidine kinase
MLNEKQLHRVAVLVPLLGLVLLELMREFIFPAFWQTSTGRLAFLAILVGGVLLFSWGIFGALTHLQQTVLSQKSELERLYQESQRQAARLRALHDADLSLTSDLALEKVLQRVVDLSRDLIGARYGALGVFRDDGRLEQFITSGMDARTRAAIGHLPHGLGLLGYLMHKGEPIRVDNIQAHPESVGFPPNHPPMKTLLGIPLMYKGELLGDLYLTEKTNGQPFDAQDEELVLLFGAQASAAIANARLAQQLEGLAVVEERQRFAMDLHDGIIQSIYAIGLMLESMTHQVDTKPEAMQELLRNTTRSLDHVIQDIRGYIGNLAPGRFGGKSFTSGLIDLAREIRMGGLLQVKALTEEGVDESLTPAQTVELFHIVREALTNIVKHARASLAEVRVELDDDLEHIIVQISDNGTGFTLPPAGFPEAHHGLRNMHQRVRAMGGRIEVDSAPGEGARLHIVVPVLTEITTPG